METTSRYLTGKVALVTGSSRGIGRVIAEHLASLGACVVVHGSSSHSSRAFAEADSLEAVAQSISDATQSETLAVPADLTDELAVKRLAGAVMARFGRIDFLVNNAGGDIGAAGTGGQGGGRPNPNDALFVALADVRAVIERNLLTCLIVCREVVPQMMERRAGRVVNMTSDAAAWGYQEGCAYAAAKAGVSNYTRCLAAELRPYNVTANAVSPGKIVTPRIRATRNLSSENLATGGTLERWGWPMEVAKAVEFFCSPMSDYVTGQILRVDGGLQLFPV